MIRFKIDVLKELKAKGYKTTKLRNEKLLSESAIQYLRDKRNITLDTLDKVCVLLDCRPEDVIEYIKTRKVYEVRHRRYEVKYRDRDQIADMMDVGDENPDLVGRYDSLDSAKAFLSDAMFEPECWKTGDLYQVEEYYIEEVTVDEDGEDIAYGDIWPRSNFRFDIEKDDIVIE